MSRTIYAPTRKIRQGSRLRTDATSRSSAYLGERRRHYFAGEATHYHNTDRAFDLPLLSKNFNAMEMNRTRVEPSSFHLFAYGETFSLERF